MTLTATPSPPVPRFPVPRVTGHGSAAVVLMALLASAALPVLAGGLLVPGLPVLAGQFPGAGGTAVRTVATGHALGLTLLAPACGWLLDRFGRTRLVAAGCWTFAAGGAVGLVAADLWVIIAGQILVGVGSAGILGGVTTLVGDLYENDTRRRVVGYQQASMALGGAGGAILGGWLAGIHWRAPFGVFLLAVPVGFVVWFFVPRPDPAVAGARPRGLPVRTLLATGTTMFVGFGLFYLAVLQLPFLLSGDLGVGPGAVGMALSGATLVSAAASWAYPRLKTQFGFRTLTAAGLFLLAGGLAVVGLGGRFEGILAGLPGGGWMAVLAGLAVLSAGLGVLLPGLDLWLIENCPEEVRGQAVSIQQALRFAGLFLAAPAAGLAVSAGIDVRQSLLLAGGILAAAGVAHAVGAGLGRIGKRAKGIEPS